MAEKTHVEPPGDLVGSGVGAHVAFEVDVVALFDVGAVEAASEGQDGLGRVCNAKQRSERGTGISHLPGTFQYVELSILKPRDKTSHWLG